MVCNKNRFRVFSGITIVMIYVTTMFLNILANCVQRLTHCPLSSVLLPTGDTEHFFFSIQLVTFQGLPQQIIVSHFNLFSISSTLTFRNLFFGLHCCPLPSSFISSTLLPINPLLLFCTCLNHLNFDLSSFFSRPSCLCGPSNDLVPDPVHSCLF